MALTWTTYACRPLPLGGAGKILCQADGADQVKVLIGKGPAASAGDPFCLSVPLVLSRDGQWKASFFGAVHGLADVSFFALVNGVWEPGPVVSAVPLDWTISVAYPWAKGWVIARLQEIAAAMPPFFDDRTLAITGAFPRSEMSMPALVIQVQAQGQASVVVGDLLGGKSRKIGSVIKRGRQYSTSLTVEAWCISPEDRDDLARWMGGAMEVLMDACRPAGWEEPSCSLDESEIPGGASPIDGVPLFQATARLNLGAWSSLAYPLPTFYGRMAIF